MSSTAEQHNVLFTFEKVAIGDFSEHLARTWIESVIKNEGQTAGIIQFIFCTDNRLLKINQDYLNHNTLTDIITFNYNDEYDGVSGDIFISIDRVRENSEKYKEDFTNELHRVIIHGILHLLGYDDQDNRSRTVMRQKENYYLSLLA